MGQKRKAIHVSFAADEFQLRADQAKHVSFLTLVTDGNTITFFLQTRTRTRQ